MVRVVSAIRSRFATLATAAWLFVPSSGTKTPSQYQLLSNPNFSWTIDPQTWVIIKITVRFLLVSILVVGVVLSFMSLFHWMNNDGNDEHVYASKEHLGRMMIVITIVMVLLALYRLWVPDYSALHL